METKDTKNRKMSYEEIAEFRSAVCEDIDRQNKNLKKLKVNFRYLIILTFVALLTLKFTLFGIIFYCVIGVSTIYLLRKYNKIKIDLIFLNMSLDIPIEYY